MEFIVPVLLAVLIGLYFSNRRSFSLPRGRLSLGRQNAELMKVLLNLDQDSLDHLFKLYRQQFGEGAERYARQTYLKWKAGEVRPNRETFRRFLLCLPKVMSFDLKCEVLRQFREAYCERAHHQLTVFTDDWKETLTPLVETITAKSNNAGLPAFLENRLKWLADDDMELAKTILARSQARQSHVTLSLLNQEFSNIEKLLDNTGGKRRVTHELRLPLGTITLTIKRRSQMTGSMHSDGR
jgi:hypothetical protein